MDERIEMFMRDIASDEGKSPNAVALNTKQRLATFARLLRGPGPLEADAREANFYAALEARIVDEIRRCRGAATEQHLQIVLRTLRRSEWS